MTGITRRGLLAAGVGGGLGMAAASLDPWALIERAAAQAPAGCGRLADIEHLVILVQENRSFDHYFGAYRGVRGFSDPTVQRLRDGSGLSVFAQPGYDQPGFGGHLFPFHLDTTANGECTNDLTHDWGPQHLSLNGGAMDRFVAEHVKAHGASQGASTMGHYRRGDLPFYYALADAFTLCDAYHCSVLGPTDPNQLYLISAWLDPDGRHGGPVLETYGSDRPQRLGSLSWTTMPEQLQQRGISWKVYSGDNASPLEDSPLPLFSQFQSRPELTAGGLRPTYPADFMADVAAGALPRVSWIYASIVQSEHPPAPPTYGEHTASQVLAALTADPGRWSRTALLITWDENGGFFDHVAPPTPPAGTPGEFVSAATLPAAAAGIRGPIGLGFRVPLLIVSPFARGGLVCSDRFDHTSLLRLIETRFGAEVPNLSSWRRAAVGDLVSAFNFARPDASVPALPAPSLTDPRVVASDCSTEPATLAPGVGSGLPAYPVPPNRMPAQEPGRAHRPSGASCALPGEAPSKPGTGSGGLSISIHRVPRRCVGRAVSAHVHITHVAPLASVKVHVNGRTVLRTRRSRFTVHVAAAHLHPGHNRIAVIARDRRGRFATATVRFRRC